MKISDIMTRQVVTVALDDSLGLARALFEQHRFHHLLVLDDKRLAGVISDRDLLKALSPRLGTAAETASDLATLNKRVHQVMSRKPIVLDEHADVRDAVALFNNHKVSCVPVVNTQGAPVGILSWRDVLRAVEPLLQ